MGETVNDNSKIGQTDSKNDKLSETAPQYLRIIHWAGPRGLFKFPEAKTVTVYHDDPNVTEMDKVRQTGKTVVNRMGVMVKKKTEVYRLAVYLHLFPNDIEVYTT